MRTGGDSRLAEASARIVGHPEVIYGDHSRSLHFMDEWLPMQRFWPKGRKLVNRNEVLK
jgi:hypothetical protein